MPKSRREALGLGVRVGVVVDLADAALGDGDEQLADGRVVQLVGDVEQALGGGGVAEAAVELGGDGHESSFLAQAADAGRRGLPRGLGRRAERGADVLVAEVVAVAEEDGGALLLGQVRRSAGAPPRRGAARRRTRGRARRPRSAACRRSASSATLRRDLQRPGAQVAPVLERRVGPQRAQEGLLERVVGGVAPEHAPQLREHGPLLLLVEPLERGDRIASIIRYKRSGPRARVRRAVRWPCDGSNRQRGSAARRRRARLAVPVRSARWPLVGGATWPVRV